ncbi:ABC transporter substrate-binding protein [Salipaludibacillus neizhouensis]|uniref:ABC transporter substrate-binding protein n=1 Tax=Salipaludibacillus neizhouensis TaxID=885475 RepID=A0A3A9KA25_9BACI|nr:sugar ABC transporter substrate-binding protein [Salipaludibacillus neizhouensis]RKL67291.1 ABC transporter substrate-binding protein [Salipaludibacillus neizhouensis]
MKKRLSLLSIVIILFCITGVALSFHTFSNENRDTSGEEITKDQIELTFWRNAGNSAENQAYEELISEFEAKHPSTVINMKSIPYNDYEVRLRTELAAGNPPDIMTIDNPNLALYANAGSLLSLDQYMKSEGNIDDIPEATLNVLKFNDEIFLAPVVESGIALFYNKHIFREAGIPFPSEDPNEPMTWDEVRVIAEKITKLNKDVYGIDPAQGFAEGEAAAYFKIPLLWQFGAEVLSPDETTSTDYLDSKEALEALQFYQDLYHKYKVAEVELPPRAFESGKLAMTVLGSWTLAEYENKPNHKIGEYFGVAPLPMAKERVVPNGGWALGLSSQSNYKDEAWEFIKYVSSYDGMKKYAEITGDIPARYSVARDMPEINEYPKNIFLHQVQNYSKNRPGTLAYPVISDAIKTLFEDVGIGGKNVKESAKEATEKINKYLEEL